MSGLHSHRHGGDKSHGTGSAPCGLHDHIHAGAGPGGAKALWIAAGATLGFAGVEALAGVAAGSLALVSDAGHMATDSLALVLAGASALLARAGPDSKRTFGWAKAESVAGLLNAGLMLALIVWIAWQAIGRISQTPEPINGPMVLAVGAAGLGINLLVGWMLWRAEPTLSVRAALLHTVSDALGSVGAMVAGAGYALFGWAWLDPALSLGIAVLVGYAAWGLMRETFNTLIDAAPRELDVGKARAVVANVDGVIEVLDFHIWRLGRGEPSLSAHLRIAPGASCQLVIAKVESELEEKFGIRHCTIQPHEGLPDT